MSTYVVGQNLSKFFIKNLINLARIWAKKKYVVSSVAPYAVQVVESVYHRREDVSCLRCGDMQISVTICPSVRLSHVRTVLALASVEW